MGVGRSEESLLGQVEVEEVAILVEQKMVIGENLWELEHVEENESGVVNDDQNPWGEGRRSGPDGSVGSWDD